MWHAIWWEDEILVLRHMMVWVVICHCLEKFLTTFNMCTDTSLYIVLPLPISVKLPFQYNAVKESILYLMYLCTTCIKAFIEAFIKDFIESQQLFDIPTWHLSVYCKYQVLHT